jgi:hypothetical protein
MWFPSFPADLCLDAYETGCSVEKPAFLPADARNQSKVRPTKITVAQNKGVWACAVNQ